MRFRHRAAVLAILAAISFAALAPWAIRRYRARPAWRLERGDAEERAWAIREISKAGPPARALALVEPRLGDPDVPVRCAALEALARARAEGAVGRIAALAESDPALSVRIKALEALGDIGGDAARGALAKGVASGEPEARAVSSLGLGRCGRPDDAARLKALLSDPVPSVREAAREGLALLDWKPTPAPAPGAPGRLGAVFEAEAGELVEGNFEIFPIPGASDAEAGKPVEGEGRWVRNPEGAGGNHDWLGGSGSSIDIGRLRFPVPVPKAGRWVLWARAWWMDKCGDSFRWRLDKGAWSHFPEREDAHDENRYRTWVWERSQPVDVAEAGMHLLEIQAREDGIRIDRLALYPSGARPAPDAPADFDPLAALPDGAQISISRATEVFPESGPLTGSVFVRRSGAAPLDGIVEIEAEDATVEPSARVPVVLEGAERFAEVAFRLTLPTGADRRERRVVARFVPRDPAAPSGRRELILSKPWPWEIAGPYKKDPGEKGIPGADWKPLPAAAVNAYKTIDFEKVFGNGAGGVVCLRARFEAAEDFPGLFLLNADDSAAVYLDGDLLMRSDHRAPAEGFLARRSLPIAKGEHRVFAVVRNQGFEDGHPFFDTQNYWLFRLRLRRDNHVTAPVRGLPAR